MSMHIAETAPATAATTAEVSVETSNSESTTLAAVNSPDQENSRENTLQSLQNESPDLFGDPEIATATEPTATPQNKPVMAPQENSQPTPEQLEATPVSSNQAPERTQSPSLWDRAANIYSSMKEAVVDVVAPAEGDTRTFTERLQSGFTSVAENCTDFVCDIFGVDEETRASWKQTVSGFVSSVFSFFKTEPNRQVKSSGNSGDLEFEFLASSPDKVEQTDTHHQQQQANGPDTPYIPSRLAGIYRIKNSWEEMAAAEVITEAITRNLDEEDQDRLQEREHEEDYRTTQVEAARAYLADTHDNSQVLEDYVASEADFSYRKSVDELIAEVQSTEGQGNKA